MIGVNARFQTVILALKDHNGVSSHSALVAKYNEVTKTFPNL